MLQGGALDCKSSAWRHGEFDSLHAHMVALFYYCEPCRKTRGWTVTLVRSIRFCDSCGEKRWCYESQMTLLYELPPLPREGKEA